MGRKTEANMRMYHRYLGFFLAGIMAMYAISGIVLIFRNTDFLKKEVAVEKTIKPNVKADKLGDVLKIKHFKVEKTEGAIVYFEGGSYDSKTGLASYTQKKLPFVLDKMTKIHKATSSQPLFFLNIFFGASLLFFVVSAFWMFRPSTPIFKKGLYFALGGLILTLILLFV
ncbi:hypothetical protein N9Y48_04170 [Zobellia sp.]|nr:hypothetical protein [Zobellia sp.]